MTPATSPDVACTGSKTPARAAPPDWAAAREDEVLDCALRRTAGGERWDDEMAVLAARDAGLSRADAALLIPNGACDLAALLWRRHDACALDRLASVDPAALKVRACIRAAVLARVEAAAGDAAAVRASAALLARPPNLVLGARLGWSTADRLWRWAGDTATDENHYSKRAILAGVLAGAAAVRLRQGREAAERWVDDRIATVMRFERWKAALPKPSAGLSDLAGRLGRLRYGARGSGLKA